MESKNKDFLVKKSNALLRASWSPSSVWEARLIAIMAAKINVTDEDFKLYEIHISEFIEKRNMGGTEFEIVDRVTDYMLSRPIKIYNKKTDVWVKSNVFTDCSFDMKTKILTVRFAPILKPHYLKLKEAFAYYQLNEFLLLPSTYSQRIFEILVSYKNIKSVRMPLDELHIMVDSAPSMRKDFAIFRRGVLERAKRDIENHTSMRFKWTALKKGRKSVQEIKFTFLEGKAALKAAITSKKKPTKKSTKKKPGITKKPTHAKLQTNTNNELAAKAIKCLASKNNECPSDNPDTPEMCVVCHSMNLFKRI